MGAAIGYVILAIIVAGMVGGAVWLFTNRAFPVRQKTPPDLSAFRRHKHLPPD